MDKKTIAVLIISCAAAVTLAGCGTSSWFERKEPAAEMRIPQPQAVLTPQEQYYLDSWTHAANLAESARDYPTAVGYYKKIKEYFPDLKEGQEAGEKLKQLKKR